MRPRSSSQVIPLDTKQLPKSAWRTKPDGVFGFLYKEHPRDLLIQSLRLQRQVAAVRS
jgi:hypothetical protein